jgi:hypothetical protein
LLLHSTITAPLFPALPPCSVKTEACLRYSGKQTAVACVWLALKLLKLDSHLLTKDGRLWWVALGVSEQHLEGEAGRFSQLHEDLARLQSEAQVPSHAERETLGRVELLGCHQPPLFAGLFGCAAGVEACLQPLYTRGLREVYADNNLVLQSAGLASPQEVKLHAMEAAAARASAAAAARSMPAAPPVPAAAPAALPTQPHAKPDAAAAHGTSPAGAAAVPKVDEEDYDELLDNL